MGGDLASVMLSRRQAMENWKAEAKEEGKAVKGGRNLQVFDGFTDWSVINPEYRRLQNMLLRCPGHVYCTAEVDAVDSARDNTETKGLFGAYGVKPRGQKRTAHIFQTVLLMKKKRIGEWTMTTVKDRGRKEVEDVEVGDFGVRYLRRVAGWK